MVDYEEFCARVQTSPNPQNLSFESWRNKPIEERNSEIRVPSSEARISSFNGRVPSSEVFRSHSPGSSSTLTYVSNNSGNSTPNRRKSPVNVESSKPVSAVQYKPDPGSFNTGGRSRTRSSDHIYSEDEELRELT